MLIRLIVSLKVLNAIVDGNVLMIDIFSWTVSANLKNKYVVPRKNTRLWDLQVPLRQVYGANSWIGVKENVEFFALQGEGHPIRQKVYHLDRIISDRLHGIGIRRRNQGLLSSTGFVSC